MKDFLSKGPDQCLSDRLNEVEVEAEKPPKSWTNPLGILQPGSASPPPPASPVIRPVDALHSPRPESAPEIPIRQHKMSPSMRPISPLTRHSTPMRRPSPLIRADFDQDLAIDRLSTPIRPRALTSTSRSLSDGSQFEYRDFPPFSQRSRSNDDGVRSETDDDDIDNSPTLPEAVIAIRKTVKDSQRRPSGTVIVDAVQVAFAKPDVKARKFTWIHLPFNNPTWVKVRYTASVLWRTN